MIRRWLALPVSFLLYNVGELAYQWGWPGWIYDTLMRWDFVVDTWGGLGGWISDEHA